jgi:hypothetical protein
MAVTLEQLTNQELDEPRVNWMIRRFENPQCAAFTAEKLTFDTSTGCAGGALPKRREI